MHMTLEGSRIRPMPGSPTARSRNWSIWPYARVSNCARAICGWPSAPPSWSGAIYPCASVQARQARAQIPANPSRPRHSRHPPQDRGQPGAGGTLRSAARSRRSASADPRSILCMRPRSNVSAKARPARLTSSAANPSPPPKAASLCCTPRHCTAIRMTAIRSAPVINGLQALTGIEPRRVHVDKGYRDHNYPDRFKVWISGQVRRVTKTIRREIRRKAAVEPSSATSRPITAWAEITSRAAKATASTRCSPPQDSTSACCCDGSNGFCAPCLPPSAAQSSLPVSHKQAKDYFLHGRLRTLMSLKSHHSSGPFSGLRR